MTYSVLKVPLNPNQPTNQYGPVECSSVLNALLIFSQTTICITFILTVELTVTSMFRLSMSRLVSRRMCVVCLAWTAWLLAFQEHREPTLYATDEYTGHNLPGGRLALSLHDQWIATAGRDGRLTFRQLETLVRCCSLILFCSAGLTRPWAHCCLVDWRTDVVMEVLGLVVQLYSSPLPSNRHHRSSGDCLEDSFLYMYYFVYHWILHTCVGL